MGNKIERVARHIEETPTVWVFSALTHDGDMVESYPIYGTDGSVDTGFVVQCVASIVVRFSDEIGVHPAIFLMKLAAAIDDIDSQK